MQASKYNSKTHSCDLIRENYEGKKCSINNDCINLNLNCDYKSTHTCKRDQGSACFVDSDCITSLKCINQLCQCVRQHIYFLSYGKTK